MTLLFTTMPLPVCNRETVSLIFVIKVTPFENLNNTHKLFMQIKRLSKLAFVESKEVGTRSGGKKLTFSCCKKRKYAV